MNTDMSLVISASYTPTSGVAVHRHMEVPNPTDYPWIPENITIIKQVLATSGAVAIGHRIWEREVVSGSRGI